ncbi:MAG: hypothetical protein AAF291_16205 [Pseudomonadota bacterium]
MGGSDGLDPVVETNRQTSDLIEDITERDEENQTVITDREFMDSSVINIAPGPNSLDNYVIDDAVTGAGNEDLWIKNADEENEEEAQSDQRVDPDAPDPDGA